MEYQSLTIGGGEALYAHWLNVIPIVGGIMQQFNGPFNINLDASKTYTDYAILYFSEDVKELGGVNTSDLSNRVFDVRYCSNVISGHYSWNKVRLHYENSLLYAVVSGVDASPFAISDMSDFDINKFDCIGSFETNA